MTHIKSPDYLGHKPTKNDDVVRIGRRPLIFVGTILCVVVGVTTYTLVIKSSYSLSAQEDSQKADPSYTIPFLAKKQSAGIITAKAPPEKIQPSKSQDTTALLTPPPATTPASDPYQDAQFQLWQQQEQEKIQMAQAKRAALQNALTADTTISSNQIGRGGDGQLVLSATVKKTKRQDYSQPQQPNLDIPTEPPDAAHYLLHTRVQPISPYEIKAGTIIPAVMVVGINSDLPGQIMAQVSQNVYDTATGRYLLIPQGCKVVGIYDHQVILGQQRVLIVWNRLIYPDASSVNLGAMPGADAGGYAGFQDKVNTHFWPKFQNALMLSAITAGVQLSQPKAQAQTQAGTSSSQQMIAGSMGMQMNQLGMLSVASRLNQAPTIMIRPGYVFNVAINKDVILPPWQSGAIASGGAND